MGTWISNVTTSGSTTYPLAIGSGTTWTTPVYVGGGGGGAVALNGWPSPDPVPQSPLEWLDAEIEKTCALARGSCPASA